MLGVQLASGVVEIGEIAGPHIHRAHRHARLLMMRVDAVKIGKSLQRGFERAGVVVAGAGGAALALHQAGPRTRLEEPPLPLEDGTRGLDAVEPDAQRIGPVRGGLRDHLVGQQAGQPRLLADVVPESAQLLDPALGRIASDHGCVQRAD